MREVSKVDTGAISTGIGIVSPQTINVFPNPSEGQFTIVFNSDKRACATVYNEIGVRVYEADIDGAKGVLDMSGQPAGIYILYLRSEKSTFVRKLEIIR